MIEIKDSVPAESYRIFMEILLDTIRNEIGESGFKTFKCLEELTLFECVCVVNASCLISAPSAVDDVTDTG